MLREAKLPEVTDDIKFQNKYTSISMLIFEINCSTSRLELYVVHTPANALFIKLGKVLKFTLKYTLISLLHVSVYVVMWQHSATSPRNI